MFAGGSLDFRESLILAGGFCVAALLFLAPVLWTDSRVIQRIETVGRIVSVSAAPMRPERAVGRGISYNYVVELPDGRRVRIPDSTRHPHLLGSWIAIEKAVRENGRVFYAFRRPGNPDISPTYRSGSMIAALPLRLTAD